jgi:hypothetical protein
MGFTRVRAEDVPDAKWFGYDKRRRARLAVFKRALAAERPEAVPVAPPAAAVPAPAALLASTPAPPTMPPAAPEDVSDEDAPTSLPSLAGE